jgi:pseudoazurin
MTHAGEKEGVGKPSAQFYTFLVHNKPTLGETVISRLFAAALISTSAFAASLVPAQATEHTVLMRNSNGKGKFMLFEPDFIKAEVGDTVKFVPKDKGHNAETIPEVWPEGAPELKGELNQEAVLTIEKPGIYAIKCLPHYPMGMTALITAGELTNKGQLDSYAPPGTAEKRFNELKTQVGQ